MARVFVDTNVLFPFSVMDLMLALTEDRLHDIVLTDALLAEWQRVIVRKQKRPEHEAAAIAGTIREFFAESFVEEVAYGHLIDQMPGSDADDRIHMAAAIAAGAGVIITCNHADFPSGALARYGIRVLGPDEYLCELITEAPAVVVRTVVRLAAEKRRPPMTPVDLVNRYSNAGVPNFAIRLKDRLDIEAPGSPEDEEPQRLEPSSLDPFITVAARDVAGHLAVHRPPTYRTVRLKIPAHTPEGDASHVRVFNVALMEVLTMWPEGTTLAIGYDLDNYAQAVVYPPHILTEIGDVDNGQMAQAVAFGWMDPNAAATRHNEFVSQSIWDENPVREWMHPFDPPSEIAAFVAASVRAILQCDPADGYTVEIFNNDWEI
jgi:predicted nucleic acid-binding protein